MSTDPTPHGGHFAKRTTMDGYTRRTETYNDEGDRGRHLAEGSRLIAETADT